MASHCVDLRTRKLRRRGRGRCCRSKRCGGCRCRSARFRCRCRCAILSLSQAHAYKRIQPACSNDALADSCLVGRTDPCHASFRDTRCLNHLLRNLNCLTLTCLICASGYQRMTCTGACLPFDMQPRPRMPPLLPPHLHRVLWCPWACPWGAVVARLLQPPPVSSMPVRHRRIFAATVGEAGSKPEHVQIPAQRHHVQCSSRRI